jgi:hypothetical protein
MKNTKLFLAIVAATIISFIVIAAVNTQFSDVTFHESLIDGGTWVSMFMVGWILPTMVGIDVYEGLFPKPVEDGDDLLSFTVPKPLENTFRAAMHPAKLD